MVDAPQLVSIQLPVKAGGELSYADRVLLRLTK